MCNMLSSLVLVAFWLLAIEPTVVRAEPVQQFDQVDVGPSGTCPSVDDVERLLSMRGGFAVGRGWTFILRENAKVYQTSFVGGQSLTFQPGLFKRVVVYDLTATTHRALIKWESPMQCAWIEKGDLLLRPEQSLDAIEYGPQPVAVGEIDPDDKGNILPLKAVLNNLNIRGDVGISAYKESDGLTIYQSLNLFETYTIFASARGTKRGAGHGTNYYLLGSQSGGKLVGWVHEDDVYLWPSRMAAYWAGTGLGRGWADEHMEGRPLIEENKGYVPPENHNIPRFPVLDMYPISAEVQRRASAIPSSQRNPLTLSGLVDRYRIAVPFKACRPNSDDCKSAEEMAELRRRYAELVTSLHAMDIVFLIDGTESMDPYFASTAEAITEFARESLGTAERASPVSIRIGAYAYGDYLKMPASIDNVYFIPLVPMHDPRVEGGRALDALRQFKITFHDPNADDLEAPFAGIIRAAEETRWRDNAAFHILIHIADDGNREFGQTSGQNGSKLVETVDIERVIATLASHKIIYIPINVLGNPDRTSSARVARAAFLRQSSQIARRLTPDVTDPVFRAYSRSDISDAPERRTDTVLDALHKTMDGYGKAVDETEAQEFCARNQSDEHCNTLRSIDSAQQADWATRIAQKVTSAQGLTQLQMQNIFSRKQTVSYAWVRPITKDADDPVDTLSYWFAVDREHLHALRGAMHYLCEVVRPDSGDVAKDIFETLRTIATIPGEDVPSSHVLHLLLSLPFWERLDILSLDTRVIQEKVRANDADTLKSWAQAFCTSDFLLQQVENGRRLCRPDQNSPVCEEGGRQLAPGLVRYDPDTFAVSAVPRSLQRFDWSAQTDVGEKLFFVPLEFLP